jgi:chemotaxis protein histidine kinase CheA
MNKTLLLIICDFLLLNLLALTRWDKMEPVPTQKAPVPQLKANIAAPQNDLADMMKVALENEKVARGQLEQRLQFAESDVKSREQTMAQMQAQKAQLESNLTQSRQKEQDLSQRYTSASAEATQLQSRAQQLQQALTTSQSEMQKQQQNLAALEAQKAATQKEAANLAAAVQAAQAEKSALEKQLQQSLAEKQAELERQRLALAAAEQARNAAVQQAANFATSAKVAEKERDMLRDNVRDLKGEREKLQAQTTELAGGVTKLATKTGELRDEIRENTPINMNLMFSEFLSNRVDATVAALGPGNRIRQKETKTVLVREGGRLYALMHISETPFSLIPPAIGMNAVSGKVASPNGDLGKGPVLFWSQDPRIVMVPVDPAKAAAAKVKTYTAAQNPFKFTEAVLISRGGRYYGEVEFKLEPRNPEYVRMKNRILGRAVFGEFSPSAGDLVLSKTGEFLGIMVNSDYCAVAKNLIALPDDTFDEHTVAEDMRRRLEEFRRRLDALPLAFR